jgi:hypothetical protein
MPPSVSSRPEFRRRPAAEPCLPPAVAWRSEGFAEDLDPVAVAAPLPSRRAAARDGWRLVAAGMAAALSTLPPIPRG